MYKDVSFDYAVETASCHFGMTYGTSCLSEIWELPSEWSFFSAKRRDGTCAHCSVDKRTGAITSLPPSTPYHRQAPNLAKVIEVPWKFRAAEIAE